MNIGKLIRDKEEQLTIQNYIEFTAAELNAFRLDEAQRLVDNFHGRALMKIPATEIDFFEWLQENDPAVWDDLWKDEENLYLTSIDLLPQFMNGGNRFPICDLIDQPNYWFTSRHIKPRGMEVLKQILAKLEADQKLELREMFLLALSMAPTDIWHFSFENGIPLEALKAVVEELVYEGLLVHLTDREDLVKYIDI